MPVARYGTKTEKDSVPRGAQQPVGEPDRWAKHYEAGHRRGYPVPGTHWKDRAIRNSQESTPNSWSLLFPTLIPAPGVTNLLLQVAFSGGLAHLRWETLRGSSLHAPRMPSSPFRDKRKLNSSSSQDFLFDKT